MRCNPWREASILITVLILATALIAVSGADLTISSQFYIAGGWLVGEQFPWKLLYRLDRFPAILLAVGGLCAAALSFRIPAWRQWKKGGVFLTLFLILGPGLLVNTAFKGGWGRPRPRDIVQFDGKQQFLQPWQKGISGQGRSFPSGHASAAFYMIAPFFIYRRRRPRVALVWLIGGTIFGVLMSIARIAQGGHFLSDNLWAFGMVYLTGLLLSAVMRLDKGDNSAAVPD